MGLGGGGSSRETVVQEQTAEPWSEQKDYLKTGFSRAESDVLNTPTEFYGGETYVPFSGQTEAALTGIEDRVMAGNPLVGAAEDSLQRTLEGDYMNPYIDQVTDSVVSAVRPQIEGQFAGAGRLNSALSSEALGRGIARGVAPYQFGAAENERQRQMQAAGMAPEISQAGYDDYARLLATGQLREGQAERELADDMSRFYFEQEEPRRRLAEYMGLVSGNYGQTATSNVNQPYQGGNSLLQGIGALGTLAGGIGALGAGFCWVAREVYGLDPAWHQFRARLFKAPRFVQNAYIKHGPGIAAYIADKPRLKRALRVVMDIVRRF